MSPTMRLLALPDIHDHAETLDLLAGPLGAADVVLLPGDLTHYSRNAPVVLDAVRRFNPRVYAIPGNWDKPHTLEYLEAQGVSLHRRCVVEEGVALAGMGGALPFTSRNPMNFTEAEYTAMYEALRVPAGVPLVLVSHQPPQGTRCAAARWGMDAGSRALRAYLERAQPLVCFCGHIHEGVAVDRVGGTLVVNPGPYWQSGRYGWVDIENGVARAELRVIMG